MVVDKEYNKLSDAVYWLDPKHFDYSPTMKAGNSFKLDGLNYKILKTKHNPKNGMQAMAVAPIDKMGKVNTNEIVIACAGTNFNDAKDRATDVQTVIQGAKELTRN